MSIRRSESEDARSRALWTRELLECQPEQDCDELVRLTAALCGAPTALLTLLDERHQWFRSSEGLRMGETPREVAFCAHAIRQTELLVVKDALMDARFSTNPLVTTEPAIRFYAGVPLYTKDGHALGTLCVIDTAPRILTAEQSHILQVMGNQTAGRLELLVQRKMLDDIAKEKDKATAGLQASEELFRAFMNASPFLSYIKTRRAACSSTTAASPSASASANTLGSAAPTNSSGPATSPNPSAPTTWRSWQAVKS
jgi:hypothetical protein